MKQRIHTNKLELEYSKITEYIYIGTNKCCQINFAKPLLKEGIRADISLEKNRIDTPFGIDFYLWLPTEEHKPPNFEQLLAGACFLKSLVDQKIKTYVHCEHGHSRSSTFVAAYLIMEGMDVEEAIEFIRKRRPVIHLNKAQKQALYDFKKRLKTALKLKY